MNPAAAGRICSAEPDDAIAALPSILPLDHRTQWSPLKDRADALLQTRRTQQSLGQAATLLQLSAATACLDAAGLTVDLNFADMDDAVLMQLEALAAACGWEQWRDALLGGACVNFSEQRPAWHTALRSAQPSAVSSLVADTHQRLTRLAQAFRHQLDSATSPVHLLHIGIGGSDWGPRLCIEALARQMHPQLQLRFLSNIDGHDVTRALQGLDPARSFVIVSSKSFTTVETLQNARTVLAWLQTATDAEIPWQQRVWAVTADPAAAQAAGIAADHIIRYWQWVGGRYSVWSAVALPVILALGMPVYEAFLQGAQAMDTHFASAPATQNLPLRCALVGIWHRNFLGYGSRCIAPYDARLGGLPSYLQQLEMESNGKTVSQIGQVLATATAPVLWGFPGTDSQHTFFQWLHQGADIAPVDFILCAEPEHDCPIHHRWLVANCLAQRELLAQGRSVSAVAEALPNTLSEHRAAVLAQQGVHPGARPSTLTVLPKLDAYHLGALLALAEHKVFLQSVLWGVNAFDQPGVDYGKQIARRLVTQLQRGTADLSPQNPIATGASAGETLCAAPTVTDSPAVHASTAQWLAHFAPYTQDSSLNTVFTLKDVPAP